MLFSDDVKAGLTLLDHAKYQLTLVGAKDGEWRVIARTLAYINDFRSLSFPSSTADSRCSGKVCVRSTTCGLGFINFIDLT